MPSIVFSAQACCAFDDAITRTTDALKAHLASHGFDPLMGARPMARLIQDTIRSALADELLFGRLANGGHVMVDLDDNDKVKLVFEEETADAV